jgi:hypothetical protein
MTTYPLYPVCVPISFAVAFTREVIANFKTFLSYSTTILSGIHLEADEDGKRLQVEVKHDSQGVLLEVFMDRILFTFLHASSKTSATAFEIQAGLFLFAALRACPSVGALDVDIQSEQPSCFSLLQQARKFADDTVSEIQTFVSRCCDPRVVCIQDIYNKLKERGSTIPDILGLLDTFCVSMKTDDDAMHADVNKVLMDASRALVSSNLDLDQLRHVGQLLSVSV